MATIRLTEQQSGALRRQIQFDRDALARAKTDREREAIAAKIDDLERLLGTGSLEPDPEDN